MPETSVLSGTRRTLKFLPPQSPGKFIFHPVEPHSCLFKLYNLPATRRASGRFTRRNKGSELQAKGCVIVLRVGEDEIIRVLSLLTLLRHQYQALAACTAVEALVVAQRYTGPIHLLVTNVLMPDLSGRELSARSRHQHPGLKALYMSGCMNGTILESLTQGTCFLQKPFTQGVLLRKVRAVLDGD